LAETITPMLLQERLDNLVEFYGQRNENIMLWRRHYFEDPGVVFTDSEGNYEEPEPDEQRVVLPLFRMLSDSMQELLFAKRPTISVPKSKVDANHNVQVDEIEKILYAAWHHGYVRDQAADALWYALTSGWGVLQVLYDPKAKKKKEFPIYVVAHDPVNIYPMPGDRPNTWEYVIHAYPRLVGQIRDDWITGRDQRFLNVRTAKQALESLKDTDVVTLIDYWDEDVNAVAIIYDEADGETGRTTPVCKFVKAPAEHGYGFLPFEMFFPTKTPIRTVGERMGLPFCYTAENLIKRLSQLASQKDTYLTRRMDPPLITKTADGRDFEPMRTEAGMHIPLDLEEDAFYLEHKAPMQLLDEQIALYMEVTERGTLPRALQGQAPGAVSGITMSLLRNPTLMKVAFKQDSLERCLENVNEKMLRLIEKYVREPMYLWGVGSLGDAMEVMVDPEIIGGYYRNRVKLSASLPSDDAATVNMILSLLQGKIISADTARDVAQQTLHDLLPQSLTDEAKKVIAESILAEPTFTMALAQQAAQEAGIPFPINDLMAGRNGGTPPGNPEYGDREITMPAQTLASQTPGTPGGNTAPNMQQRVGEMMEQLPRTGATSKAVITPGRR